MEIIKSISEAFSMQPITLSVVEKPSKINPQDSIKEIKKMQIGQYEWAYIGYNFEGKTMFEYLAKSVNVHYK